MQQEENTARYSLQGDYLWFQQRGHRLKVAHVSETVSVAFDEDGLLLKHGQTEKVEEWRAIAQAVMDNSGLSRFFKPIKIHTMSVSPETVEELNRCIGITGYVLKLEDDPAPGMGMAPG